MNDFLQSIRNGSFSKDNGNSSKPRYNSQNQRPRRPYESNGNYTRNNGNEKKFRPNGQDETLTTIKETLTAILANQETTLTYSERRAIAEERKADAFEFIANHIGKLSGETFVPGIVASVVAQESQETVEDVETQPAETLSRPATSAAPKNDDENEAPSEMGKDDILELIANMRQDGSTYNEIASHLVDLNLPTFSGRGKWHAQTIHRLCQTA